MSSDPAARVAARWHQASRIKWKGNKAEGKYTTAEISKGAFGWAVEVMTNFRTGRFKNFRTLGDEGTIYKSEAKEAAEELITKWDKEIENAGGPGNW